MDWHGFVASMNDIERNDLAHALAVYYGACSVADAEAQIPSLDATERQMVKKAVANAKINAPGSSILNAIKAMRERTGCSLKWAYDQCSAYRDHMTDLDKPLDPPF